MGERDQGTGTEPDAFVRDLARIPRVSPFAGTRRYRVIDCLGEGGFGVVYEVEDRELGRRLALKTLKPHRGGRSADIRRLKSEFRTAADLVHPNLVALHDLASDGARWFFTMDLVDGKDFLQHVRDPTGRVSEPKLRAALRQLIAGVTALHRSGIVHRDLKPSNVLVRADGRVIILDFGLAGAEHADTTLLNAGTPSYMAPEQAAGSPAGPAADWYAVGVVLYEALTGRLPFEDGPRGQARSHEPLPPSTVARVVPDLERLCLALLCRDPTGRPRADAILEAVGDAPSATDDTSGSRDSTAFVGRARELAVLRAAYEGARRGEPSVVRIEGQPGVGKSALLRHFLDGLRAAEDIAIFAGRCHEREWVPFKAFDGVADALVRYLRKLPRNEASALMPRDIHLVAQLFPAFEAVEAVGDVPRRQHEASDSRETRQCAFRAFKELCARIADKQPMVIAIDDLQWGDVDSARLLSQLITEPERPAMLLVLSYRADDAEQSATVEETRRMAVAAGERGPNIRLVPLAEDDAERLAARLLGVHEAGRGCSSEAALAIARRAEGHPLFMAELARAHLDSDQTDAPPPTVIDILWRRVLRLSEGARALLETVAIAGQPLPSQLCFEAAGLGTQGVDAVRVLRAAQLIVTSSGGAVNVFHDRIREAILARSDATTRRERHLALARSLEQGGGDLEALARHFQAAGERPRAGIYAARAGDAAMRALAFDRAASLFRMAIDCGAETPARPELYEKLGDALVRAGSDAAAGLAYLEAAQRSGGMERIQLTRRAAESLLTVGDKDRGFRAADRALSAVDEARPPSHGWSLFQAIWHFMWLRIGGFRFRERQEAGIAARELLRLDVMASIARGIGYVSFSLAFGLMMRFSRLAFRVGEPRRAGLALVYSALAWCGHQRSRRKVIDELLDRAEGSADRFSDVRLKALAVRVRGETHFLFAGFVKARELCEAALALMTERCPGSGVDQRFLMMASAMCDIKLGELDRSRRAADALLLDAVERGDPVAEKAVCLTAMVPLSLAKDAPSAAAEYLVRVELEERCGNVVFAGDAEAMIAMYLGQPRKAVEAWRRRWPKIANEQLLAPAVFKIGVARSLGTALLASPEGHHDLREAAQWARSIRRFAIPYARAVHAWLRACLVMHAGRPNDAAGLLWEAAEHYDEASMPLEAAACRYRHGRMVGGAAGAACAAAAELELRTLGIVCPKRWVAMHLPDVRARRALTRAG